MEQRRQRAWIPLALTAIAGWGTAIAAYLTATHENALPLVCTINSVVNCAAVTHSAYSVIPGTSIPISILGVTWFVISGFIASVALRAAAYGTPEPFWVTPFQLIWAGFALVVVLYLVYVEIVVLHQICEWCTVVHVLVVATFVLALIRLQRSGVASGDV
jgi:uncharacterized membrane protein